MKWDPRDLIDTNLEAEKCGLHLLYMLKVYSSLPLSKVQHSQQANSKGNKCHVSLVRWKAVEPLLKLWFSIWQVVNELHLQPTITTLSNSRDATFYYI